jgi:hypothetical protein
MAEQWFGLSLITTLALGPVWIPWIAKIVERHLFREGDK